MLIFVFVFTYADCWLSHNAAQITEFPLSVHFTVDILRLQPHIERMTVWEYVTAMNIIYSELRGLGRTCEDVVQILRVSCHRTFKDAEVIKLFSCSAQLTLKFILLINVKMLLKEL